MYFMATQIGIYLLDQLEKRGWSQNELARRSGLTSGTISNTINGVYGADQSTLISIANALKVSKEEIFRAAGILPPVSTQTEEIERLNFLFNQLDDTDKTTIIQMMEFFLQNKL